MALKQKVYSLTLAGAYLIVGLSLCSCSDVGAPNRHAVDAPTSTYKADDVDMASREEDSDLREAFCRDFARQRTNMTLPYAEYTFTKQYRICLRDAARLVHQHEADARTEQERQDREAQARTRADAERQNRLKSLRDNTETLFR